MEKRTYEIVLSSSLISFCDAYQSVIWERSIETLDCSAWSGNVSLMDPLKSEGAIPLFLLPSSPLFCSLVDGDQDDT